MKKLGILLIVIFTTIFVGCKKEKKEVIKKSITFNLGSEPKSIDPQINSAVDGGIVINNTFEGLMRRDAKGNPVPATASSYTVSEDGKKYVFTIREDAKWSDGQPVEAKDFEYSWKRALDPKVGSEYAFQLFYLENGQEYFNGKVEADKVGVKAIDDRTLEVDLVSPTPYFLGLTTFGTLLPVREDIVEKKPEGWAKDTEILVSNGPFVVKEYIPGDKIRVEKNPYYWNNKNIDLEEINFLEIVDASTALTGYNNDEIGILTTVPSQEIPRLQLEDSTFSIEPYLGVYYYVFNVEKEPTNDINVRKALTFAIDRDQIVEQVTKAGQVPATGFVPLGLKDSKGNDFRKTNGDFDIPKKAKIEKAREYLAKAGYPNGEGFPVLTVMYNTNENHKSIAEAIQAMWKENLGIDVKLMNQEWAVFQDTRNLGSFEIARGGWIGDYTDPMTFLDLWTSYSVKNYAQWKWTKDEEKFADNKRYDEYIEASKTSTGVERDENMYNAEKLLMKNYVSMPIYYYTGTVMTKEYIKGWERDVLGTWYLGNVKLDR